MTLGSLLATVLASGTVAAVISHVLSGHREQKFPLRQKAEDLYVSIESFENDWGQNCVMLNRVVIGHISYNEMLDLQIEREKRIDGRLNRRMFMLTEIYFPETLVELKSMLLARDNFNSVQRDHKEAYASGQTDIYSWSEHFVPLVNSFSSSCIAHRAKVVELAQRNNRLSWR